MEANELRIGNLVGSYNKGEEDRVLTINAQNILVEAKANKQGYTRYRPIPLTEEWLLKFGFMKSKVSSQFDKEKLTIQIANELEYHKKGRVYFNSWAILEESIKYVHQLQNLYFALTGEELTIKE